MSWLQYVLPLLAVVIAGVISYAVAADTAASNIDGQRSLANENLRRETYVSLVVSATDLQEDSLDLHRLFFRLQGLARRTQGADLDERLDEDQQAQAGPVSLLEASIADSDLGQGPTRARLAAAISLFRESRGEMLASVTSARLISASDNADLADAIEALQKQVTELPRQVFIPGQAWWDARDSFANDLDEFVRAASEDLDDG